MLVIQNTVTYPPPEQEKGHTERQTGTTPARQRRCKQHTNAHTHCRRKSDC